MRNWLMRWRRESRGIQKGYTELNPTSLYPDELDADFSSLRYTKNTTERDCKQPKSRREGCKVSFGVSIPNHFSSVESMVEAASMYIMLKICTLS
tara:strand:- start:2005 stop:2289 length:285 start_codon:yes stop_codon:yes gene_type:complete